MKEDSIISDLFEFLRKCSKMSLEEQQFANLALVEVDYKLSIKLKKKLKTMSQQKKMELYKELIPLLCDYFENVLKKDLERSLEKTLRVLLFKNRDVKKFFQSDPSSLAKLIALLPKEYGKIVEHRFFYKMKNIIKKETLFLNEDYLSDLYILGVQEAFYIDHYFKVLSDDSKRMILEKKVLTEEELKSAEKGQSLKDKFIFIIGWFVISIVCLSMSFSLFIFWVQYLISEKSRNVILDVDDVEKDIDCYYFLTKMKGFRVGDLKNYAEFKMEEPDLIADDGVIIEPDVFSLNYKI